MSQPNGYPAQNSQDNTKLFSILAYIPFLWLVGLLADRQNPKVMYHVNQGIILTICQVVINVALWIVSFIITLILPIFSILTSLISIAAGLLTFAFIVLGIVNAANGVEKPLPIIGTLFVVVR